jgi:hypothetical protein
LEDLEQRLSAAAASGELVQIERDHLDPTCGPLRGHLLAFSGHLVLLTILSDRLDLDGYQVLRRQDITAMSSTFSRKAFYERALALKGEVPVTPEGIRISTLKEALRSVQESFPLLVIEREQVAPGECEIGQLKLESHDSYALHWISPEAEWEDDPTHYKFSDITRVSFGGE